MFLQTYVVPVCLFVPTENGANVRLLSGTAFFINSRGTFLTARHVVETAERAASRLGFRVGLVVKLDSGKSAKSGVVEIQHHVFAPSPYDVAVGQVPYGCDTIFRLNQEDVEVWKDIATIGYPENAVGGDAASLRLNIRCHKGYVQRITHPDDIKLGAHPAGFELSFLVSAGISGAPLFVHHGDFDNVIGVCVGSIRSEIIEDAREEVDEAGRRIAEKRLRISEFGLAHDIRPLLAWQPSGLQASLSELANA